LTSLFRCSLFQVLQVCEDFPNITLVCKSHGVFRIIWISLACNLYEVSNSKNSTCNWTRGVSWRLIAYKQYGMPKNILHYRGNAVELSARIVGFIAFLNFVRLYYVPWDLLDLSKFWGYLKVSTIMYKDVQKCTQIILLLY
jgi:hypothetical protein